MSRPSNPDPVREALSDLLSAIQHSSAHPQREQRGADAVKAAEAALADSPPPKPGSVRALRAKLSEMTLHDDTGDRLDVGYMQAVDELKQWLADSRPAKPSRER